MPADLRVDSLAALARRYGSTPRRRTLLRRLRAMLAEARSCGFAGDVYVGGSFTTARPEPGDLDIVLDCAAMPAWLWPRFARGVIASWSRWDALGVSVHLSHPSIPRDVRDVLRRDRRGRLRRLVVVGA
jgi:hypothetical protein